MKEAGLLRPDVPQLEILLPENIIDLDEIKKGELKIFWVKIKNVGSEVLDVRIKPEHKDFWVEPDKVTLGAGEIGKFKIIFENQTQPEGDFAHVLEVISNDALEKRKYISVTGTILPEPIEIVLNPSKIDLGSILSNQIAQFKVELSYTGDIKDWSVKLPSSIQQEAVKWEFIKSLKKLFLKIAINTSYFATKEHSLILTVKGGDAQVLFPISFSIKLPEPEETQIPQPIPTSTQKLMLSESKEEKATPAVVEGLLHPAEPKKPVCEILKPKKLDTLVLEAAPISPGTSKLKVWWTIFFILLLASLVVIYNFYIGSAKIFITTQPSGAKILINGKELNSLSPPPTSKPLVLKYLKPGKYELEIKLANAKDPLKPDGRYTINLKRGEKKKLNIVFNTLGFLEVISNPPGAEVVIDRKNTGKLTPQKFTLPSGTHIIEVKKKDYIDPLKNKREVIINWGESKKLEISLKPAYATVKLNITPLATKIYLDSKFIGIAKDVPQINVNPGKHKIEFILNGYNSVYKEINLSSNQQVSLNLKLSPISELPTIPYYYLPHTPTYYTPSKKSSPKSPIEIEEW